MKLILIDMSQWNAHNCIYKCLVYITNINIGDFNHGATIFQKKIYYVMFSVNVFPSVNTPYIRKTQKKYC